MILSSNTSNKIVVSTESSTSQRGSLVITPNNRSGVRPKDSKSIQNAVYAYVQAVRALGRKQLNTIEIAEALSIPVAEVNQAVTSLKKRGVKVLNV